MKQRLYDPLPWGGHPERESKRTPKRITPQHACDLLGGSKPKTRGKACARRPH